MNPVIDVYRHVLDDVIHHVKPEFENEGLDDHVLHHLQQLWERKLMESNVFAVGPPGMPAEGATSADGGGGGGGGAPTPTSAQLMSELQASLQGRPNPPHTQHAGSAQMEADVAREMEALGQPQRYMPPASDWAGSTTTSGVYLAEDKAVQQNDGACDEAERGRGDGAAVEERVERAEGKGGPSGWEQRRRAFLERMEALRASEMQHMRESKSKSLTQLDGEGDDDDSNEGSNSDEELGSDLDDTDEEPIDTDNRVLCKFEKVIRIKTKRKCQLKDGVMHLNGKDYMFGKANGEFEF